ncbi:hypothetical protein, partial [Brevibacterium casei]|uniref:hypothetical protein n=1 Tax=Brevibacterium casei TaxID=33889 RepID=UPI001CBA6287
PLPHALPHPGAPLLDDADVDRTVALACLLIDQASAAASAPPASGVRSRRTTEPQTAARP